jgi:hypothetical protein
MYQLLQEYNNHWVAQWIAAYVAGDDEECIELDAQHNKTISK